MAEQDNVGLVRAAYAAFRRGDIPGLINLLADDVDWWTPGEAGLIPYAGRARGHAAVGGFFEKLAGAEEITHFEPQEFVAQGDKVVVTGNYRGRTKPSGRDYDLDWLHVFTVRDGKIAAFREYIDTAALAAAHHGAAARTA